MKCLVGKRIPPFLDRDIKIFKEIDSKKNEFCVTYEEFVFFGFLHISLICYEFYKDVDFSFDYECAISYNLESIYPFLVACNVLKGKMSFTFKCGASYKIEIQDFYIIRDDIVVESFDYVDGVCIPRVYQLIFSECDLSSSFNNLKRIICGS